MGAERGRKRGKREGRTFVEATPATPPGSVQWTEGPQREEPVGLGFLSRPAPPHLYFLPAFPGDGPSLPPADRTATTPASHSSPP